eukprot:gene31566-6757_t
MSSSSEPHASSGGLQGLPAGCHHAQHFIMPEGQPRYHVLETYSEMVAQQCERSVITFSSIISACEKAGRKYVSFVHNLLIVIFDTRSVITFSSIISACEKAGRWELGLHMFSCMQQEGCQPNTITYNSVISVCAQGGQWKKAYAIYEEMQQAGCQPDVVTYTALVNTFQRCGMWRQILQVMDQMMVQGCEPDHVIYGAIIGALWETGNRIAQQKAA